MSDYGSRIKETRKLRGLTQQEVADAAGMSVMTIRRYESGERTPNIESLRKIAGAMGCSVADIIPPEPRIISSVSSELTEEEKSLLEYHYEETREVIYSMPLSADNGYGLLIDDNRYVEDMREKIVNCFYSLNDIGKKRLLDYASDLIKIEEYDIDNDIDYGD